MSEIVATELNSCIMSVSRRGHDTDRPITSEMVWTWLRKIRLIVEWADLRRRSLWKRENDLIRIVTSTQKTITMAKTPTNSKIGPPETSVQDWQRESRVREYPFPQAWHSRDEIAKPK